MRLINTLNGIEYSDLTTPLFESESSPLPNWKLSLEFIILGKGLC